MQANRRVGDGSWPVVLFRAKVLRVESGHNVKRKL